MTDDDRPSSAGAAPVPANQLVEPFRRLVEGIPHVVWITQLHPEQVIYVSPSFEQTWGRTPEELYADPRIWTASIHPEDRPRIEASFGAWITGKSAQCQKFEYRVVQPSGEVRWITDIGVVTFDAEGRATRVSGVCTDITDLKLAEREHLTHLWFFESLDRVNQAIQGTDDLEQMMRDVLAQLLEIFDCDRAWLVAPTAAERGAESARAGFATSGNLERFALTHTGDDVQRFGVGHESPVAVELAERLQVHAAMSSQLQPKGSPAYVLALHHCRGPRAWTNEQEWLFREIGRRLGDAIGTLCSVRSLRESEQRLEAAQRQAHLGYWSLDLQTHLVTFSAETFRICGMEPDGPALGLADLKRLVHPADLERVAENARRSLQGNGEYQQVNRIVRPSSELRYVHTEGHVVRSREGKPLSLFGTAQDITERKRAEQLFAAQHAVTKLLTELTSPEEAAPRILQAICETLDWDLGLIWQGPAPATATWRAPGVEAGALIDGASEASFAAADGSPWFVPDVARADAERRLEVAAGSGLHAAFGFRVRLSSGDWASFAFFSRDIRQRDPDLLAAMTTLGSQIGQFVERRRAETALQRARDQLAHVTRVASLGELTASIAHEVNQPLTGIIANGQAALRWLQRDPPEIAEATESLQRLVRDGKRAGEVVGRLRTLVRQGEETRKTSLDVSQVVRETLPLVRSEVQQNDVAIVLELSNELACVFADRVQLQQVLLNLIMNALESMVSVVDRPKRLVLRTAEHTADELAITVADSGTGVAPEQAGHIFDAFFTTKSHGMGMGLAISRSIVEDHGGRLTLVPGHSPGSAFQFTLPKTSRVEG